MKETPLHWKKKRTTHSPPSKSSHLLNRITNHASQAGLFSQSHRSSAASSSRQRATRFSVFHRGPLPHSTRAQTSNSRALSVALRGPRSINLGRDNSDVTRSNPERGSSRQINGSALSRWSLQGGGASYSSEIPAYKHVLLCVLWIDRYTCLVIGARSSQLSAGRRDFVVVVRVSGDDWTCAVDRCMHGSRVYLRRWCCVQGILLFCGVKIHSGVLVICMWIKLRFRAAFESYQRSYQRQFTNLNKIVIR